MLPTLMKMKITFHSMGKTNLKLDNCILTKKKKKSWVSILVNEMIVPYC